MALTQVITTVDGKVTVTEVDKEQPQWLIDQDPIKNLYDEINWLKEQVLQLQKDVEALK